MSCWKKVNINHKVLYKMYYFKNLATFLITEVVNVQNESPWWELNSWPLVYKTSALTTELQGLLLILNTSKPNKRNANNM